MDDKGYLNRGPYPEKSYTQICCSYRPWSHFIEFSLDFVPQVLCLIQIRTEGRPWHDSDVVLLEKVLVGSGSVGAGIVLLEHVMLVTAIIGHNVKSKDLIDIPQCRNAITSTWANFSPLHMHLRNVHLFFARPVLYHTPSKYRNDFYMFSIADSTNDDKLWPIAVVPVGDGL